jgi:hypothetical protein
VKEVILITDHEVGEPQNRLSVVVGDAQIGASIVKLGKKTLGTGTITDLVLGAGPALRGKPLYVKSAVTDVNDSTNHTSLTYRFRSGSAIREYVSMASVDVEGDSVIYRAKFNLV